MRKARSYGEIYNDLDGEVVNVFRVLRDPEQADQLRRLIELTPFARDEFVSAYHKAKNPVEQARRTIVKAFMGFGSAAVTQTFITKPDRVRTSTGFRATSKRSGAMPSQDWRNLPKFCESWTERLKGVAIENRGAIELMRYHDSATTLHYVDPPYVQATLAKSDGRKRFRYRHAMDDAAHCKLAAVLRSLKGMVVISGYDSELYGELYAGWSKRSKATHADSARSRTECLWLNAAVTDRLTGSLFEELA